MSAPASPSLGGTDSAKTVLRIVELIGLLAALAAIGRWMLWSNFVFFDDEGYILVSAQRYFKQGGLYEVVYSQYGPAFYVMLDALQRVLASPITHDATRWLTLLLWIGTAGAGAAMVWRQTASRALTCFAATSTFLYLYFLRDEACHPGSLIVCLLAGSTLVVTELIDTHRWRGAAAVAGGTAAILLLTKINVGVFYCAAVVGWGFCHAGPATIRRFAPAIIAVLFVALAVGLTRSLWSERWVHVYLAVFAVGAATIAMALRSTNAVRTRHAIDFAGAALITGSAILLLVASRGTSAAGLLEGVLLGPLRHPGNYSYAVDWRPGTLLVASGSLALALVHRQLCRNHPANADRLIVTLRIAQIVAVLVAVGLLMHARIIGTMFSYIAPLIWTWIVPLETSPASTPGSMHTRGFVAVVLLLQYLHAYPVGGSQESWATFLFLPLVALGLAEIRSACAPRTWTLVGATLAGAMLAKAGWTGAEMRARYIAGAPLDLPGAHLRLPESAATAYRLLALNAAVHADVLFSVPGQFSFNLWSGVPTPTAKNTTLWSALLSDEEQRAIIRAIEAAPKTCIIVNEVQLDFMRQGNITMTGPLRDFIYGRFAPAFRIEGYAFLVKSGRAIAPIGIVRRGASQSSGAAGPATESVFELSLATDGTPIESIELGDVTRPSAGRAVLTAQNSQVLVTPIDSGGKPKLPPSVETWPLHPKGLVRLSITWQQSGKTVTFPQSAILYLKDRDGRIVHEARFDS